MLEVLQPAHGNRKFGSRLQDHYKRLTILRALRCQIDLESTLAQAEVLFLSFRSMVEEVDRNELVRAGQAGLLEQDNTLRKRRGSVSTIGSEPKRDLVSDDLRDLLVGWSSRA